MLKKYLVWIAFFVLLSVGITGKHEYDSQKAAPHTGDTETLISVPNTKKTDQDAAKSKRYAIAWNLAYIVFGWPVGIGVCGLLITFIAIADQAVQTRKAAEASEKLVDLQREAMRPRLTIGDFINNIFHEARAGGWVSAKMEIFNSGGLPAYDVVAETWIEFVRGVPPYRLSSNAKHNFAPPMTVGISKSSQFSIPLHRRLTPEEILLMAKGQGAICLRIRMAYRAFTEDVYTDHGFVVRPGELSDIAEYTSAN